MKLRPRNRDNNTKVELDRSKELAYHPPKVGAKIFESSFFDAILEPSSCGVSQHAASTYIEYEDIRKSLELRYGVEITPDAVQAASEILTFIHVHNYYLPKIGVAQLLEAAASKLRDDFDHDSGEKDFDRYMYLFDRAFLELREVEKEKDLLSSGFPYVKEELEELKCVLEAFRMRWPAPLSPHENHLSSPRSDYFRYLRDRLIAILLDTESHSDVDLVAKAIQALHDPVFALLRTVDVSLKRLLTVNSRTVVEVASSITGVPSCFFPPPFQLPLELLVRRLSGRLVGLDSQLRIILYAMSNQKPRSSRLYSFLLLGPPSGGKTTLAHTLAKEMFHDRILEYNVADFVGKDFFEQVCTPPCPVTIGETYWTSDSSTQFISGCVVVFGNVDKANTTVLDSILQILEGGSYVDAVGRRIVFSNVLILFTLNVRLPFCRCTRIFSESSFKTPFKGLLNSEKEMKVLNCNCNFHEQLTEATDQFKPQFVDFLDDVIVIPWVPMSHHMSMFRIQVRNVALLCKKRVVVYASAAVFRHAWRKKLRRIEERGRAVEHFVDDLFNELHDVEGDSIVYIDQLLGSNELSFRIKKISDMAIVHDFRTFKESLRSSMVSYQFEKKQAKQIYKLSTAYFGLVELLDSNDKASLSCVLSSVAGLLNTVAYQLERSLVNDWMKQVLRPQPFNYDVGEVHARAKRARYMSEFSKMRNEFCEQIPLVQVVAKALFKSIDAHHGHCVDEPCQQASSFLVLGLSMDRCLVDSLSKYFVADDGTRMLVEVDLSACTNPNSFFCCTCRNEPNLLLKMAILMRPYSVIMFYNLELAHLSAFANIISILDDGLLYDDDGIVLDFRKSVIILVSNLGNKHIIAKLVGGPDGSDSRDGTITQGSIGFRFEILNRVHEILLFNPFASDQILHSARLPMKVGQHLLVGTPGIIDVLVYLFNKESDGQGKLEVDGKMTEAGNCWSRSRSDARLCLFSLRKGVVKI